MSDVKFHLVPRAAILASGDSDDFHHVAPDEVVMVAVEALEQARASATRGWEQADSLHMSVAEALRERDEARAACTLAWQRICAERMWAYDPAMDPVEALRSRLDPESAFYEAFNLDSADAVAALVRERDEARRWLSVQHDAAADHPHMHTFGRHEHSCTLTRLHAMRVALDVAERCVEEQRAREALGEVES